MGELNDFLDRAATATEIRVGDPRAPSGEEKMIAAATYLLGFVGFWLVGAVLIYFWQRDKSRFIAYHAVQSVILQMTIFLAVVLALVATIAGVVGSSILASSSRAEWHGWVIMVLIIFGYGFCLVAPVYWALRGAWVAAHGRLYEAPLFGRLAHRLVDTQASA
jgi:uncharacterized Tic20 family protein